MNQLIKGNYTDDATLLGTCAQIGTGLLGLGLPADIRDLTYDLTHWKWSWGHAGQTMLDAAGLLPIAGAVKYGDEAAVLVKNGAEKIDEGAGLTKKSLNDVGEIVGLKTTTKVVPPRDRLAELSDAELGKVHKVSTFKTKGVSEERAIDYLSNTPEGQKVLRQVSESAPAGTDTEVIFNRAMGYVQSGTDLPKTGTIDGPLVKIAPKEQGVSDYSPYFTTMDELKKAQSSNKPLSDLFGLPATSDAAKYDVFQIKPIDRANVLKSKIAPTEELGGKFVTKGGAEQIIVPNRKQFTAPEKLFSINDNV
jgi:hypothetical protein